MLINVLFPAPLGPNNPSISPKGRTTHKTLPVRSDKLIHKTKSHFCNRSSSAANDPTRTFPHAERDVFRCHFLYSPPQTELLPLVVLLVQAADHDRWHLRKERGRSSDALARSAREPCPQDPWWEQPPAAPAAPEFGVWDCSVTSSALGLLSASFTRSLSAFTSSSSFSSHGASGSFHVLTFVKHFLRGRKQHEACARHSGGAKLPEKSIQICSPS